MLYEVGLDALAFASKISICDNFISNLEFLSSRSTFFSSSWSILLVSRYNFSSSPPLMHRTFGKSKTLTKRLEKYPILCCQGFDWEHAEHLVSLWYTLLSQLKDNNIRPHHRYEANQWSCLSILKNSFPFRLLRKLSGKKSKRRWENRSGQHRGDWCWTCHRVRIREIFNLDQSVVDKMCQNPKTVERLSVREKPN